ncbi:MAG: hypothetical protein M5U35_02985 [Roseovarius sp.]|nr:hypothetical protein [Roseovarius sp.]
MTIGTQVLTGARDRLLPASVPYAFFGVACLFHLLAWGVFLHGAALVPGYAGGPGEVLAAIHLITLGVLAMTAMGAACQLLPVATRVPLWRVWPARLSFWLAAPGVALLDLGMAGVRQWAMSAGGGLVAAGLGVFALLIAGNLARARGLPAVIAHGWASLIALVGLVALGLVLIGNYAVGYLDDPARLAHAHMTLGIFGFMTLLAFGFSHILIPMFALSRTLPVRWAWAEFALSALAVAAAVGAIAAGSGPALALSAVIGLAAVAAYFRLMQTAMRTRMRKRLGARLRAGARLLGLSRPGDGAGAGAGGGPRGAQRCDAVLVSGPRRLAVDLPHRGAATDHAVSGHHARRRQERAAAARLRTFLGTAAAGACRVALAAIPLIAAGIVLEMALPVRIGAAAGLAGAAAFGVFGIKVFAGLRRIMRTD